MSKGSTKDILLEHSDVKVKLYVQYLSKYLNILTRANFLEKIYLYDLMCGEGIYSDNKEGSPIKALKTVREYYQINKTKNISIDVWFNDNGESDIEQGKRKIDRVECACNKIRSIPNNVKIKYTCFDFASKIYPSLLQKIRALRNEKMLLFLDPYGYKDITPAHISNIMSSKNVELLLFHPVTHMYRFANKSLGNENSKKVYSLHKMLSILFSNYNQCFKSLSDFINELTDKYRKFLDNKIFVDNFTIVGSKGNTYALFFFSPHIKGFETMLATKWEMDKERGKEFSVKSKNQLSIFDNSLSYSDYPNKLKKYISNSKNGVTNRELYIFGLNNGYLPKHSVIVLRQWQKENSNFKVFEGTKETRKGAFYINYDNYYKKKRVVRFTFLKD